MFSAFHGQFTRRSGSKQDFGGQLVHMCVTLTKIIFTLKCLKYFYHSSFETPKGEMPKTCFLYGKNPDIFFLLAEWDV